MADSDAMNALMVVSTTLPILDEAFDTEPGENRNKLLKKFNKAARNHKVKVDPTVETESWKPLKNPPSTDADIIADIGRGLKITDCLRKHRRNWRYCKNIREEHFKTLQIGQRIAVKITDTEGRRVVREGERYFVASREFRIGQGNNKHYLVTLGLSKSGPKWTEILAEKVEAV